jgi:hypothetical protein
VRLCKENASNFTSEITHRNDYRILVYVIIHLALQYILKYLKEGRCGLFPELHFLISLPNWEFNLSSDRLVEMYRSSE